MNKSDIQTVIDKFDNADHHLHLALIDLLSAAEKMDHVVPEDNDLAALLRTALRLLSNERQLWQREYHNRGV